VITNELQYRVGKSQLEQFRQSIEALKARPLGDTDPLLRQAQIEAMQSSVEELEEDLAEYEALRSGQKRVFVSHSFADLPVGLIQARIAAGLSQEALAERLGITKQQVQRDEENLYAGASLTRLSKVAEALGVKVESTLEYAS
jgi:DNA-binding XRE family transcriptional regulator